MILEQAQHDPILECRDAVHGFVYLSEFEWSIVDTPVFQRLRDIRQLAMAHLVYPGATHSRFEHSLGCLHLSDRIFSALTRQVTRKKCPTFAKAFGADEEQIACGLQLVRLAALLHDLGHAPFSHSGETLMTELDIDGKKRQLKHEDMTAKLIRETEVGERLARVFGSETVEEVIAVATSPSSAKLPAAANLGWYGFLNDIVAGEIGADRMDYLLRDATHTGQNAGLFDYRKLIDSMTIVPPAKEADDQHRLGLDGAGWLVAEQMVAARYLMYVALYFHKTKRIYEIHLEDFLREWLEQEWGTPHLPVENLEEYRRLTDSRVWSAIYEAAAREDGNLQALARPFVDRSHMRLACEVLLADNDIVSAPGLVKDFTESFLGGSNSKGKIEPRIGAEKALRDLIRRRYPRIWDGKRFDNLKAAVHNDVREKFGSIGKIRFDVTRHQAVGFSESGKRIWVLMNGETRYLDELSEIVSGMPERIWRGRVYANEEIRNDVAMFCKRWLVENPSEEGGQSERGKC